MRRSNSKEVKTLVKEYINDCLEVSVIEFIEQFKTEFYNNPCHKKLSEQNAMTEYLRGLPTNTSFDFATYDIINIVAEWMDCTETEKQKFEHRSEDLFYHLISREMFNLYSKELENQVKIEFFKEYDDKWDFLHSNLECGDLYLYFLKENGMPYPKREDFPQHIKEIQPKIRKQYIEYIKRILIEQFDYSQDEQYTLKDALKSFKENMYDLL